jgi:hypothetical protein
VRTNLSPSYGLDHETLTAGRYTVRVRFQWDRFDATSAPHPFTLTPAHVANPPRVTHAPGFGNILPPAA